MREALAPRARCVGPRAASRFRWAPPICREPDRRAKTARCPPPSRAARARLPRGVPVPWSPGQQRAGGRRVRQHRPAVGRAAPPPHESPGSGRLPALAALRARVSLLHNSRQGRAADRVGPVRWCPRVSRVREKVSCPGERNTAPSQAMELPRHWPSRCKCVWTVAAALGHTLVAAAQPPHLLRLHGTVRSGHVTLPAGRLAVASAR